MFGLSPVMGRPQCMSDRGFRGGRGSVATVCRNLAARVEAFSGAGERRKAQGRKSKGVELSNGRGALIAMALLTTAWRAMVLTLGLALAAGLPLPTASAQSGDGWYPGISGGDGNTTVVPRTAPVPGSGPAATGTKTEVQLTAFLTTDGQRIDRGIIWRVYAEDAGQSGKSKLISTLRDAAPTLKLEPGRYLVNAAFGRANLTRRLEIAPAATGPLAERFVLNAGGLRVNATISGAPAPANAVTYSIFSDRDQTDNRRLVMSSVKPGLIIRLNAGIYHIESGYGDANAKVESDVTVEAGKLTEATVAHAAAKVTFKLVTRSGGEALADTQWSIQTTGGVIVKESIGALPTHTLAPGSYLALAKSQNKSYSREFKVEDGETTQIEVIIP